MKFEERVKNILEKERTQLLMNTLYATNNTLNKSFIGKDAKPLSRWEKFKNRFERSVTRTRIRLGEIIAGREFYDDDWY